MKFYYKGLLVRTSKTHDYNFAIMVKYNDRQTASFCWGCRTGREDADAEAARLLRQGFASAEVVPLEKG